MKQLLSILILSLCMQCSKVQAEQYSEEVRNALLNGARVKMTVKVVDEEGFPVSNAKTRVYFRKSFGREWGKTIEGKTNNDVFFVAEEKTSDTIFISSTKDQYYKGLSQYFATKDYKLDGDKWRPWDVTNKVVLRKKINPIPMFVGNFECTIPVDTYVEFDCGKKIYCRPTETEKRLTLK